MYITIKITISYVSATVRTRLTVEVRIGYTKRIKNIKIISKCVNSRSGTNFWTRRNI